MPFPVASPPLAVTGTLSINGGVLELTNNSGDFTRDSGTTREQHQRANRLRRIQRLRRQPQRQSWRRFRIQNMGCQWLHDWSWSIPALLSIFRLNRGFPEPRLFLAATGTNTRTVQVNNGSAECGCDHEWKPHIKWRNPEPSPKPAMERSHSTGTNNYNGVTTVSAGRLLINGNQSTALGNVSVSSGATLGGTGTVGGATTISSGAFLAPGASPGTLTFANTLGLNGTVTMEIDGTAGAGFTSGHDFINLTGAGVAGALTYGGAMILDMGVVFGTGSYSCEFIRLRQ